MESHAVHGGPMRPWSRGRGRAPGAALLALALGCCAPANPAGVAATTAVPDRITTPQQVSDLLFRHDFAAVDDVRRVPGGWTAQALRDGDWVPVEVREDGTLTAASPAKPAAP